MLLILLMSLFRIHSSFPLVKPLSSHLPLFHIFLSLSKEIRYTVDFVSFQYKVYRVQLIYVQSVGVVVSNGSCHLRYR